MSNKPSYNAGSTRDVGTRRRDVTFTVPVDAEWRGE